MGFFRNLLGPVQCLNRGLCRLSMPDNRQLFLLALSAASAFCDTRPATPGRRSPRYRCWRDGLALAARRAHNLGVVFFHLVQKFGESLTTMFT